METIFTQENSLRRLGTAQGWRLTELTAATSVPTINEWGMIIFMVLAGLGSLYYLVRNRTES